MRKGREKKRPCKKENFCVFLKEEVEDILARAKSVFREKEKREDFSLSP